MPNSMTVAVTSERRIVTLRAGVVVDMAVLTVLLNLEAAGARFALVAGDRIKIDPPTLLDSETRDFLRQHRAEALTIVRHQADDSRLRG